MSAWIYCLQDGKAARKIVPPRFRIPCWKGLGADSEEKHEPASDIGTVMADSLKALDPRRPIREADIAIGSPRSDFDPRVRPLRRGGLGVVKSLGDLSSGPVVLLHTQKLELNTKSPTA